MLETTAAIPFLCFNRLCQQHNAIVIPQMKVGQHNNSNPTLLVSGIPEQNSHHQESMVVNHCVATMDKNLTSSSLLAPQVKHTNGELFTFRIILNYIRYSCSVVSQDNNFVI